MSIITVDFDGTLYQQNSITPMLKAGNTIFTIKQWFYIIRDIAKGVAGKKTGEKIDARVLFLESFFRQMKGRSEEEIYDLFVSLVKRGQGGINFDLVARLIKHLEDGDQVVILSGALQPFLEVFVQQLDIRADVIGTLLFFDENGICTGEIGKINHGVEKVNRLKLWIKANKVYGGEIWAYADSESDIPLLEFADKAIIVQPSNELKKVAEAKGWVTFIPSKEQG